MDREFQLVFLIIILHCLGEMGRRRRQPKNTEGRSSTSAEQERSELALPSSNRGEQAKERDEREGGREGASREVIAIV